MRYAISAALILCLAFTTACGDGGGGGAAPMPVVTTPNPHPAGSSFTIPNPTGGEPVKIEVLAAGAGAAAHSGSRVHVHFVQKAVGQEVHKNTRSGEPEVAIAGRGSVLPGFDLALQQMREGDKWRITFPADLGYGKHGGPKIPPGSAIEVEAEMMKVDN